MTYTTDLDQMRDEWEHANPVEATALDREGYRMRTVPVIRVHGDSNKKWFECDLEYVGHILHPFDGHVPANAKEMFAFAKQEFGEDINLLY